MAIQTGKVFLVGAGPGDPALITRKGAECLQMAEVVIYDRLVSRELLYLAPEGAELIYVGKRTGEHVRSQDEINAILLEKAREGKTLVRLKGGDPFVFGRGAEEALVLEQAGIPFEVVPGVTAAIAAAAYAGIPLTHRDWTSSVALITGHEASGKDHEDVCWEKIATCIGTIVIYMGVKNFSRITSRLLSSGRSPETPAAVIQAGTTPWQRTVTGTLATIAAEALDQQIQPPALLIVGEVVRLREQIAWHEKRPLFGKRLVVTRSRSDRSMMAEELRSRGAMVIEFPTIRISPIENSDGLMRSLLPLSQFSWLVFTSPLGVNFFFKALLEARCDARTLAGISLAARDRSTTAALGNFGLVPDLIGTGISSESIVTSLIAQAGPSTSDRVLIVQETEMNAALIQALSQAGYQITAARVYDIGIPAASPAEFSEHLEDGLLDGIVFTSSSQVSHYAELMEAEGRSAFPEHLNLFSIGPVTSDKVRERGGVVSVEATTHSIVGTAEAICDYFKNKKRRER